MTPSHRPTLRLAGLLAAVLLLGTACWETPDPDCGDACDVLDACGVSEPVPDFCASDCKNRYYECAACLSFRTCADFADGGSPCQSPCGKPP